MIRSFKVQSEEPIYGGGDFNTIETSIREVLYKLDEATTVITGHGASTTIGREIRTNAFVRG